MYPTLFNRLFGDIVKYIAVIHKNVPMCHRECDLFVELRWDDNDARLPHV